MDKTVFLLENHLGGIASFCSNLIRHSPISVRQQTILLTSLMSAQPKIPERMTGRETIFTYSPNENFYSVLRRLRNILPCQPGALISNSSIELALASQHELAQTVFQVVHDAFNLRLAMTYEPVVDVFIAHSRHFYDELRASLPHRVHQIFHLPYGIWLSPNARNGAVGPLRLVFLGRITEQKGVLDLPIIDAELTAKGISVNWTIIGDGPLRTSLMERWSSGSRIQFSTPLTNAEVLKLCAQGDVLVFPTRFEGFPVALLEAMSVGLVPVVSDLPSGVPEVVSNDTGFRVPIGDIDAFVRSIKKLDEDRRLLENMSLRARERAADFDIKVRAPAYHNLFAKADEFKRPWQGPMRLKLGSRLDHPLFPNVLVRSVRNIKYWLYSINDMEL